MGPKPRIAGNWCHPTQRDTTDCRAMRWLPALNNRDCGPDGTPVLSAATPPWWAGGLVVGPRVAEDCRLVDEPYERNVTGLDRALVDHIPALVVHLGTVQDPSE